MGSNMYFRESQTNTLTLSLVILLFKFKSKSIKPSKERVLTYFLKKK